MAKDTDIALRNKIIYSVYVRNHSSEGSFKKVTEDLKRIKDLGTDIVWLMPIHPIGQVNKKGSLGCPYSISDYRKVNPEYGTLEDFKELVEKTHLLGMKIIIDVVYNHTSHDSVLFREHKEWFYKKADGNPGNKVGDWSDIIDLDYNNKELCSYQIETLKYWTSLGVDGFRCDVAPLIPVDFWKEARKEIGKLNKDAIWLSESVDPMFINYLRENNVKIHTDSEIYEAFDILYDYDTYKYWVEYIEGKRLLQDVIEKKTAQEYIYPDNYIKLRFLENHDQNRAADYFKNRNVLENWTAFMFFEKGTALIYGGQEAMNENTPSLFEKDPVDWSKLSDFEGYIKTLCRIKKKEILSSGIYNIEKIKINGVIEASYKKGKHSILGIFNVEQKWGYYPVNLSDGEYENLVNGKKVQVQNGCIKLNTCAIIIESDTNS